MPKGNTLFLAIDTIVNNYQKKGVIITAEDAMNILLQMASTNNMTLQQVAEFILEKENNNARARKAIEEERANRLREPDASTPPKLQIPEFMSRIEVYPQTSTSDEIEIPAFLLNRNQKQTPLEDEIDIPEFLTNRRVKRPSPAIEQQIRSRPKTRIQPDRAVPSKKKHSPKAKFRRIVVALLLLATLFGIEVTSHLGERAYRYTFGDPTWPFTTGNDKIMRNLYYQVLDKYWAGEANVNDIKAITEWIKKEGPNSPSTNEIQEKQNEIDRISKGRR